MAHPYWPLYDLCVTTPRIEIRLPTEEELYGLLAVTDAGVHDPSTMPFSVPWTDTDPPRRHRESLQWWWSTGSWLGRAYQGGGLGKEMRAAVLHLAFEGLGAREAHTRAFADNAPSLGVTRAMGYVENGHEVVLRRGKPARSIAFCLERSQWAARRRADISISGLEPCLEMFGVAP